MTLAFLSPARAWLRSVAPALAIAIAAGVLSWGAYDAGARHARDDVRIHVDDSVRAAAAVQVSRADSSRRVAEHRVAVVRDSARAAMDAAELAQVRAAVAQHVADSLRASFTLTGDTVTVHRDGGAAVVVLPPEVAAFVRVTDTGVRLRRDADSVRVAADSARQHLVARLEDLHAQDSTELARYADQVVADRREIDDLKSIHTPRLGFRAGVVAGGILAAILGAAAHFAGAL